MKAQAGRAARAAYLAGVRRLPPELKGVYVTAKPNDPLVLYDGPGELKASARRRLRGRVRLFVRWMPMDLPTACRHYLGCADKLCLGLLRLDTQHAILQAPVCRRRAKPDGHDGLVELRLLEGLALHQAFGGDHHPCAGNPV